MLEDRTLEVSWNNNVDKRYLTCLLVHMNDNKNHMLNLIQDISSTNVSVDGIKIISKGEKDIYELTCYVTGLEQLEKLILLIEKNSFVDNVDREFR